MRAGLIKGLKYSMNPLILTLEFGVNSTKEDYRLRLVHYQTLKEAFDAPSKFDMSSSQPNLSGFKS